MKTTLATARGTDAGYFQTVLSNRAQRLKKPAGASALRLSGIVASVFIRFLFLVPALHLSCINAPAFDLAREPAIPTSQPDDLWLFLPIGYLFTVAIEAPVLLIGLSRQLGFKQRLFAGLWLTACTYPIVVLVLPIFFASSSRSLYLLVAETFAPAAECALFWLAFKNKLDPSFQTKLRNFGVIVIANLLSFAGGEMLNAAGWFGLF